eukprot:1157138-Pelagomonas_calceolata.AAC.1
MAAYVACMQPKLATASPSELAIALKALARLHFLPTRDWLNDWGSAGAACKEPLAAASQACRECEKREIIVHGVRLDFHVCRLWCIKGRASVIFMHVGGGAQTAWLVALDHKS